MRLQRIWSHFRQYIPESLYPFLAVGYRLDTRLILKKMRIEDSSYFKLHGKTDIPPADLRYRISKTEDIESFIKRGEQIRINIENALSGLNMTLKDFNNALDFGCGCGGTLRSFKDKPIGLNLYGTDIDAEAVEWCMKNLDFARFSVNGEFPPLPYGDETFDLCWAVSVFTHIDEEHQYKWLSEIKRIMKPGGIVMASVHGESSWKELPSGIVKKIKESGLFYIVTGADKGVFPDWYQNTWHFRGYVEKNWVRYFELLSYIPEGMSGQDLIVMRKKSS